MKKRLSYLLLLILTVIIPINAKALTGSINISCDKEIYKIGDTATCNVTGTSDVDVYSISAKINNISSSNTTIEFETDSSWQGNGEEGNVQLYTDSGKKGTFNIGKLTIKLTNTTTDETTIKVSIDDIKYGDTNGSEYDIEPIQKSISFTPILLRAPDVHFHMFQSHPYHCTAKSPNIQPKHSIPVQNFLPHQTENSSKKKQKNFFKKIKKDVDFCKLL